MALLLYNTQKAKKAKCNSLNSSMNNRNDSSLDNSSISKNLNNNGTLDELKEYVMGGDEAE